MKRFISLMICILMLAGICSVSLTAGAAAVKPPLQFDENGEFTIMHISDVQDSYPIADSILTFIDESLKKYKPDLVVLGGDNTVNGREADDKDKIAAVEQLCKVFTDNKTYFTLVFGNHDRQQILGYNDLVNSDAYGRMTDEEKEAAVMRLQDATDDKLLAFYMLYGGEYCLAYDANPSLHGSGTHVLTVVSKDDILEPAYKLFMLDSGENAVDENGDSGYDYVRKDQIEWMKDSSAVIDTLAGKKVNSMAFQHIIVGEIMDALKFPETKMKVDTITKVANGKRYLLIPNITGIDGWLGEIPCPGVGNDGELDALSEIGCTAVFSGHDHTNEFTVNINGVDVVNTPGCTFNSYGKIYNRGARLITIHEDKDEYETTTVVLSKAALESGSKIIDADDNVTKFSALMGVILRNILYTFVDIIQIF